MTKSADGRRFEFGNNWNEFISNYYSEERLEIAKQGMEEWFSNIEGKSFLDIGCGSGLYSRAAYELGAAEVVSFDYDEDSVKTTSALKTDAGDPNNWTVIQGDILNSEFVDNLAKFDRVMAWGVLHHTGSMWRAIDNTMKMVADDGEIWLAIYNDSETGRFSSDDWLNIKQFYSRRGWFGKRSMEAFYTLYWMGIRASRGKNPIKELRSYKEEKNKGMAFYPDVKDWLGGIPYEYASVAELNEYIEENWPNFEQTKLKEDPGTGNNEFLYRKAK